MSEANSAVCCVFQDLLLIEVRGICLPSWELKVLASTSVWKECGNLNLVLENAGIKNFKEKIYGIVTIIQNIFFLVN